MQLGDRWKLTIPSELAFGSQGRYGYDGTTNITFSLLQTVHIYIVPRFLSSHIIQYFCCVRLPPLPSPPLWHRSASAGKPRIPGDAVIVFDVEVVGLPGKEPELIELIGSVDE